MTKRTRTTKHEHTNGRVETWSTRRPGASVRSWARPAWIRWPNCRCIGGALRVSGTLVHEQEEIIFRFQIIAQKSGEMGPRPSGRMNVWKPPAAGNHQRHINDRRETWEGSRIGSKYIVLMNVCIPRRGSGICDFSTTEAQLVSANIWNTHRETLNPKSRVWASHAAAGSSSCRLMCVCVGVDVDMEPGVKHLNKSPFATWL